MTEHLTNEQVAALQTRSVPVLDTFALLEHAATCPECRKRIVSDEQMQVEMTGLRRTLRVELNHLTLEEINDVADRQIAPADTQRIDAHLDSCSLCQQDVDAVRRMSADAQSADARKKGGVVAWLEALFGQHQMLLAVALVLVMTVAGGWLVLRHGSSRGEAAKVRGTDVAPPSPASAAGPASGTKPNAGTLTRDPDSTHGTVQQPSILAVALLPGVARRGDGNAEPVIHLPPAVQLLKVTLKSRSGLTAGRYTVRLAGDSRSTSWRKELIYRSAPNAITATVPAALLAPGRYTLTLAATEDGTDEDLADYVFRVAR